MPDQWFVQSIKRIALASAAALVLTGTLSCSSKPRPENLESSSSEPSSENLESSSSLPGSENLQSRSSLPADYVRLAQLLASGYFREDGKLALAPARLDAVTSTKNAALRPAIDELAAARQQVEQLVKSLQANEEEGKRFRQEWQKRAESGEFDYEYWEYEGNALVDHGIRTGLTPALFQFANLLELEGLEKGTQRMIGATLERSRMEAWRLLLPKLGEIYGKRPARSGLATARIEPADPVQNRHARFAILNTSSRALTDVTLLVDLVHFTEAPNVSSRQVLFVPQWPVKQVLYLNTRAVPNMITKETSRRRPQTARPGFGPGFDGGRVLVGAAGAVEVRVSVWAAEARQPELAVKFPEVVRAGARFEMDVLNRETERDVMKQVEALPRDPNAQERRATFWGEGQKTPFLVPPELTQLKSNPELPPWLFRGAPHISELVPGSELEREAQALLADPVGVIRQRRQQQLNCLMEASRPGRKWAGTWAFQLTPEKREADPTTPDSRGQEKLMEVLRARVGSKGRFALTFETAAPAAARTAARRSANQAAPSAGPTPPPIAARLSDPDHPSSDRRLVGHIIVHDDTHIVLQLKPAPAARRLGAGRRNSAPPPKAQPNPAGQHTPENDDLTLELTGDGNEFTGFARSAGDTYRQTYGFGLVLKSEGN